MKALEKAGFILDRIKGSHHIYFNSSTGRRVTVPYHNKDLKRSTLNSIIKESGLSREEFLKLL